MNSLKTEITLSHNRPNVFFSQTKIFCIVACSRIRCHSNSWPSWFFSCNGTCSVSARWWNSCGTGWAPSRRSMPVRSASRARWASTIRSTDRQSPCTGTVRTSFGDSRGINWCSRSSMLMMPAVEQPCNHKRTHSTMQITEFKPKLTQNLYYRVCPTHLEN